MSGVSRQWYVTQGMLKDIIDFCHKKFKSERKVIKKHANFPWNLFVIK